MKKTIYLSSPALLSALGEGPKQHFDALFDSNYKQYLSASESWVQGKSLLFGAINTELALRPFPDKLAEGLKSHNNQLLWHALSQIEPMIEQVITRYGRGRVAVVMGTSTSGSDENITAFQHYLKHQNWATCGFSQEKQLLSSPSECVVQLYDLKNLAYTVSTACTSGSRAIISAARLLELGICDAVICGGVDSLSQLTINGFDSLEVLSKGHCQPFAESRDGINIGEAVSVFIATREPLSSDDSPVALYGFGASSDAYHMSSPRPDALGAVLAINKALSSADCKAEEISWVNLHGTGTEQNDSMEASAIAQVFGDEVSCTSTKALTGHTLGAAGALEAAFVWLTVNSQYNPTAAIPPHRIQAPFDPAIAPIHLTGDSEFYKSNIKRLGLSTSFAFGGNNTALILGEA